MSIAVGIMGYGNLARGLEQAIKRAPDMELRAVFTRRAPESVSIATEGVRVLAASEAEKLAGELDVLVLCGGSASDLPEQTPKYARLFTVVDSFDTHARIPEHFAAVDSAAKAGGNAALISCGWDPGLFSLCRLYSEAVLPDGSSHTFWGRGVSQGHSDALRRVSGVLDAKQYTVPNEAAAEAIRRGENPTLTQKQMHRRECFVVAADDADRARIEAEIKAMPNYFAGYETEVHFVSAEEFRKNHSAMPHGGSVLRCGHTGKNGENSQLVEYRLRLSSNPEFTSSVVAACARAAHRLKKEGFSGCRTLFDVPPAYLSPYSAEELRQRLL